MHPEIPLEFFRIIQGFYRMFSWDSTVNLSGIFPGIPLGIFEKSFIYEDFLKKEELQTKFPEKNLKQNQKESQRYFLGVLEGCPYIF